MTRATHQDKITNPNLIQTNAEWRSTFQDTDAVGAIYEIVRLIEQEKEQGTTGVLEHFPLYLPYYADLQGYTKRYKEMQAC